MNKIGTGPFKLAAFITYKLHVQASVILNLSITIYVHMYMDALSCHRSHDLSKIKVFSTTLFV